MLRIVRSTGSTRSCCHSMCIRSPTAATHRWPSGCTAVDGASVTSRTQPRSAPSSTTRRVGCWSPSTIGCRHRSPIRRSGIPTTTRTWPPHWDGCSPTPAATAATRRRCSSSDTRRGQASLPRLHQIPRCWLLTASLRRISTVLFCWTQRPTTSPRPRRVGRSCIAMRSEMIPPCGQRHHRSPTSVMPHCPHGS